MRASTRWPAWSLAVWLAATACAGDPQPSDSPAAAAPSESPGTAEQSPTAEADASEHSVVRVEAGQGSGPGVVVTAQGHILASADVVASADGPVRAILGDGTSGEAAVVGSDPQSRLAVVKLDGATELTPAVFADSPAVQRDDEIRLISGQAGSDPSVVGVVRATDSIVGGSVVIEVGFEPDAPTTSGPLVNGDGEVVGILMTISTGGGDDGRAKIGHALPSDAARRIADELIESGQVVYPYLGAEVGSADGAGALVHEVIAGSPAGQAGLQAGDVVIRLGDLQVAGPQELVAAVRSRQVGDEVALTVLRDGAEQRFPVVLGQAPAADSPPPDP